MYCFGGSDGGVAKNDDPGTDGVANNDDTGTDGKARWCGGGGLGGAVVEAMMSGWVRGGGKETVRRELWVGADGDCAAVLRIPAVNQTSVSIKMHV